MQMPIQPDETFLREIFGVLRGSRHPVTKLHNTMLIPANKFGKGRLVARLGLCYRVPIRIVVHAFPLKSNTPPVKKFHTILRNALATRKHANGHEYISLANAPEMHEDDRIPNIAFRIQILFYRASATAKMPISGNRLNSSIFAFKPCPAA